MKTCPHCQAKIEENARFCLYCMTSLDEKQRCATLRKRYVRWQGALAAVLAFVLALGTVLQWPEKEAPFPAPPVVSVPGDVSTTGTAGTEGTTTTTYGGSTTAGSREEAPETTTGSSTTVPTFQLPMINTVLPLPTNTVQNAPVTIPAWITAPTKESTRTTTTTQMKRTTTTTTVAAATTSSTTTAPATTTTTKRTTTTTTHATTTATPYPPVAMPVFNGSPKVGTRFYVTPYFINSSCSCFGPGVIGQNPNCASTAWDLYTNPYYEAYEDAYFLLHDFQFLTVIDDEPVFPPYIYISIEYHIPTGVMAEYIGRFIALDKSTGDELYYSNPFHIKADRGVHAYDITNIPIDDPDDYNWRLEYSFVVKPAT